jgi:hypothetical protein
MRLYMSSGTPARRHHSMAGMSVSSARASASSPPHARMASSKRCWSTTNMMPLSPAYRMSHSAHFTPACHVFTDGTQP